MTIRKSFTSTTSIEDKRNTVLSNITLCESKTHFRHGIRRSCHHDIVQYRGHESSRKFLVQILDEALLIASAIEEEHQSDIVVVTDQCHNENN